MLPFTELDEQILQKIMLLNPQQKQTVYELIESLLRNQLYQSDVRNAALLNISVWDEQAINEIEEVQKQINAWQIPTH